MLSFSKTSGMHDMNSPQCLWHTSFVPVPLDLGSVLFCFLRQAFMYPKLSWNLICSWGSWTSSTQCRGYRCSRNVRLFPHWESKKVSYVPGTRSTSRALSPALGLGFGYKLYPIKDLSWTLKRMFQRHLRASHHAVNRYIRKFHRRDCLYVMSLCDWNV